jgi:hypothetical protein
MLVVYNGQDLSTLYVRRLTPFPDLGCFVDQVARQLCQITISSGNAPQRLYHRGPHLLLFPAGYIEVRTIDMGKLVRMIEVNGLRLLGSDLSDWPMRVQVLRHVIVQQVLCIDLSETTAMKLLQCVYNKRRALRT